MSRYTLEPRDIADRHLEIVIGWDPPLHTYFVQVLDPTCDEEDSGFEILWCGLTPGEIPSADEAILLIAPPGPSSPPVCAPPLLPTAP